MVIYLQLTELENKTVFMIHNLDRHYYRHGRDYKKQKLNYIYIIKLKAYKAHKSTFDIIK